MREKLLEAEAWTYRKALVSLLADAMSGGRKTIDKDEIARLLGPALERGNELSRRQRETA